MTNFTWNVTQLFSKTIEGITDYVVIANYKTIGVDGKYTASLSGTAQFSTENVTNFIPYKDLTEAIVIDWIKQTLGENGIISIEACIQGQIDSQINPPVSPTDTPLPWN
jgi:hypothetical protein